MRHILKVAFMLGIATQLTSAVSEYPSVTADQIKGALFLLREGASEKDVDQGLRTIEAAGVAAFPFLLEHMNDARKASLKNFALDQLDFDQTTGKAIVHHPTLGEVSFRLIQDTVEGEWFKAYRGYRTLTPTNVREWLKKRVGYNLWQLRLDAAKESFEKAKAQHLSNASEATQKAVEYTQSRLDKLKNNVQSTGK
jgi:hypothetical protein